MLALPRERRRVDDGARVTSGARQSRAGDPVTIEIRRLSTLLEASQALSGTLDLKAAVHRVLEILARHHGAIRSTVVLRDEQAGDLQIDAVDGVASTGRLRHPRGDGVTARVVQSGKPIVVPRVSREPLLAGRGGEHALLPDQERSYLCVPISLGRKAVGAIAR